MNVHAVEAYILMGNYSFDAQFAPFRCAVEAYILMGNYSSLSNRQLFSIAVEAYILMGNYSDTAVFTFLIAL